MLIHEYQAKELLRKAGLPLPAGQVAGTKEEVRAAAASIGAKVAVKAQVHVGGRGKAGGIKLAATPDEASAAASQILGMNLKGLTVRKVLVEQAVDIAQELYLGITVDRAKACNVIMFSPMGGVDIEEVAAKHPDQIFRCWVHPMLGLQEYQIRDLAYQTNLPAPLKKMLMGFIRTLYDLFVSHDASIAEINPLAVTKDGVMMAADAKINLDDNALFRRPDLLAYQEVAEEDPIEREAHKQGLAYVRLPDGYVGIIGNGAGLVMTTLDEVARAGGKPANFLDVGGGAKAEVVRRCFDVVLSDPNVKGVVFNIFGGITRGDEVAQGIIDATKDLQLKVPVVIRLSGTRAEEGMALLKEANFHPVATMREAAQEIVNLIAAQEIVSFSREEDMKIMEQKAADFLSELPLSKEHRIKLSRCKIVLLPWKEWRGKNGPFFPLDSNEFYSFMTSNLGVKNVGIAATEDAYKEISLNSDIIILPWIFCVKDYIPQLVDIIIKFVSLKLKKKPEEAYIKTTIFMQIGPKNCVKIPYEGPASNLKDVIAGAKELRQLME